MKKFLYLTVMALLIFSTQLFAAGQQDEKAVVEVTADEDAAIVTEAGSGDLKLIFWNGLTGSDGVTLDGIIENYTKKNTDVFQTCRAYR
jgi:hypothetical protein